MAQPRVIKEEASIYQLISTNNGKVREVLNKEDLKDHRSVFWINVSFRSDGPVPGIYEKIVGILRNVKKATDHGRPLSLDKKKQWSKVPNAPQRFISAPMTLLSKYRKIP